MDRTTYTKYKKQIWQRHWTNNHKRNHYRNKMGQKRRWNTTRTPLGTGSRSITPNNTIQIPNRAGQNQNLNYTNYANHTADTNYRKETNATHKEFFLGDTIRHRRNGRSPREKKWSRKRFQFSGFLHKITFLKRYCINYWQDKKVRDKLIRERETDVRKTVEHRQQNTYDSEKWKNTLT